jgi:regulator of protease activity HflC (stomatin/prohibitin superfamily)
VRSSPTAAYWTLLTHSFGKEFTTAVEQKQIAQQDAERAKFVVEKAEQERQAAVIRAEGEAEAANTISKALNRAGDAFVQFRKIEAAREIGEFFTFWLISRGLQLIPFSWLVGWIKECHLCPG